MVVKMIRWPRWPPLSSKKFEAVIIVQRLEGLGLVKSEELRPLLVVEIKWKGQKGVAFSSLRRSIKRNFTREVSLNDAGVFDWNQEFRSVCTLTWYKENSFFPWEVMFTVSNVSNQGPKNRASITGVASINLAEFMPAAVDKETEIVVPLNVPGTNDNDLSLCLSLSLLKLGALQEYLDAVERSTVPVPLSPCSSEALSTNKDEFSTLKAGLRKVKIFTGYVSVGRAKKASCKDEGSDGVSSNRSEDAECSRYVSDTDSLDDTAAVAVEPEESKEDSGLRHSLSYDTLASINYVGGSPYTSSILNGEDECWVHYNGQKSDFGDVHVENYTKHDKIEYQISKHRILPWRKRKLNFRSPKVKGELLLKKHYGEEGGDDIDHDRRQLSYSDEDTGWRWHKTEENTTTSQSFVPEFEENNFTVGSWEHKEVTSRDGQMKLQTQVFFASFDQRNEHAAGESACAVLVAMITDWLKVNPYEMPIKCEFDSLIIDGSTEWRNLCDNKAYIKRFPDKHFDLDTILQAKIRPIAVVPQKSFVGFFIPEELEGGGFDFLHGAMSFDSIWEEISHSASELHMGGGEPLVYVVSWNDHFFVLKVEPDAYYIIDTLGERLYEGCNQAYILKFDVGTTIVRLPNENQGVDDSKGSGGGEGGFRVWANDTAMDQANDSKENAVGGAFMVSPDKGSDRSEEIICRGKESCKEYIKNFLAAIPVRELQVDLKKGLKSSMPIHHRLQIEFHYTHLTQPMMIQQYSTQEAIADASTRAVALAVA